MRFAGSAADVPPPPTVAEVAARFPVPLVVFAPQASLEESGIATTSETRGDGALGETSATVSYTLWREPADRADPVNLAELTPELRAALETPPLPDAPDWLLEARGRLRYPMLWEAVRTTVHGSVRRCGLDELLLEHATYVLVNAFRETRSAGRFPATVMVAPTAADLVDSTIALDGVRVRARSLDRDPDVLGVGVELDARSAATVVIARDALRYVDWRFARRSG